jgi:hypothetical protein
METPRPTLDVVNLTSPPALKSKRRSALKKIVGPAGPVTSRVLSKYRKRQTQLLGESDEDPCPYKPTYVFYCLDSPIQG